MFLLTIGILFACTIHSNYSMHLYVIEPPCSVASLSDARLVSKPSS